MRQKILALIASALLLGGCATGVPQETETDREAYEKLAALDPKLAEAVKDIETTEDEVNAKLIPLAEHYFLQKEVARTPWDDIADSSSSTEEVMILTDVEDAERKLIMLFSRKTRGVHLFVVKKGKEQQDIQVHSLFSRHAGSPNFRCSVDSKGRLGALDENKRPTKCEASATLIEKTAKIRSLLREQDPDLQRGSALSYAIDGDVMFFGRGVHKIALVREGDTLAMLTTNFKNRHYVSNFVSFFKNGY